MTPIPANKLHYTVKEAIDWLCKPIKHLSNSTMINEMVRMKYVLIKKNISVQYIHNIY